MNEFDLTTSKKDNNKSNLIRQIILYFIFAIIMIGLNILIQNLFKIHIFPYISKNFGDLNFFKNFILLKKPINMPELIGSAIAVVITYIIKFILDKIIVFQNPNTNLKETAKQFSLYFIFAIITTLENLGIQLLLAILTFWSLNLRIIIALTCGYTTKFLLDRKYCFISDKRESKKLKKILD